MIIQGSNSVYRDSSQDDIIVYDKSLTPPVLVSSQAPEGVFLYNSVLMRTEVKSVVTAQAVKDFIASSCEVSKMTVTVREGYKKNYTGAINAFVTFGTDLRNNNPDSELMRFIGAMKETGVDPTSGIVSSICVVGRGFWKIGIDAGKRVWLRLDSLHLVWYVGVASATCFHLHTERVGGDPAQSLESGIGLYLPSPYSATQL